MLLSSPFTYVYIDESGETGTQSSYIIFASIETMLPRPIEKAMRKVWNAKPQFHGHGELHANSVDDATRTRVLKSLAEHDLSIRYTVIDKAKVSEPLASVYYQVLAEFIGQHPKAHIVIVDRKDTEKKRKKMLEQLGIEKAFVNVEFEISHKIRQLQAVDFVAWAIGRYYEHGDAEFMNMIQEKIHE